MPTQILGFRLSHHFMLKIWERMVDNQLLYNVLPEVKVCKDAKKIVIITPSFLIKKGFPPKSDTCLVIVIQNKLLDTAFWCDHPNYLFKKEKQSEFQIIY